MIVCIVISDPLVIAVYTGERAPSLAQRHARTITGASVLTTEALTELPDSVIDALHEDFDDDDTPVTSIP